jgi:chromosome segregation ATPase
MAARLGNKANRSEFLNQFWYGGVDDDSADDGGASSTGFLDLLKSVNAGPADWSQAVKQFQKALKEERELREERQKAYQAYIELFSLRLEIPTLESTLRDLEAKRELESDKLHESQNVERRLVGDVESAKSKRLEHRRLRPGLLEILLSLGKAFQEWRAKDKVLAASTEQIEERLSKARDQTALWQRSLDDIERESHRVSAELDRKRQMIAARREELDKAEER